MRRNQLGIVLLLTLIPFAFFAYYNILLSCPPGTPHSKVLIDLAYHEIISNDPIIISLQQSKIINSTYIDNEYSSTST
ncbi:MAG: hypothetical protein INQ03_25620 [Candidatus Heimdallarchaeota archaeon]|nr:hypothetical protein [Candidatus Heimdallarchaeota archaeon]